MRTRLHQSVSAVILGALPIGGAYAQTATRSPSHKGGQIEYLSGDIGKAESSVVEAASQQWPLTIEFAVKDKQRADFAADVKGEVRDSKGKEARADGPFPLAKLAPAPYVIDATLADKVLHEKMVNKYGQSAKTRFVRPAGNGEPRS